MFIKFHLTAIQENHLNGKSKIFDYSLKIELYAASIGVRSSCVVVVFSRQTNTNIARLLTEPSFTRRVWVKFEALLPLLIHSNKVLILFNFILLNVYIIMFFIIFAHFALRLTSPHNTIFNSIFSSYQVTVLKIINREAT